MVLRVSRRILQASVRGIDRQIGYPDRGELKVQGGSSNGGRTSIG